MNHICAVDMVVVVIAPSFTFILRSTQQSQNYCKDEEIHQGFE
jgi:hypothetical protein